ncbi:hypothetical protein RJT34_02846 [Clitoria ternatea]|uniref:Uncharacterized protein n=1 Tax=Clitoria ternatea TaxID=43366 RepID=A0AAN9KL28_CLITE
MTSRNLLQRKGETRDELGSIWEVIEDSFDGVVKDSITADVVVDSFEGVAGNLVEDSLLVFQMPSWMTL